MENNPALYQKLDFGSGIGSGKIDILSNLILKSQYFFINNLNQRERSVITIIISSQFNLEQNVEQRG